MTQNNKRNIVLSRSSLIVILLASAICGALLAWVLYPERPSLPDPAPKTLISEPIKTVKKPAATPQKKPAQQITTRKPVASPGKETKTNTFVIKGLISTAGEPWSPRHIRVKLLWLKNSGKEQLLLGHENAQLQMTKYGPAYQIVLKSQPANYVSFNGGVEGNIARIIAFLDHQGDGKLSPSEDRIIAVSKEILRYRTGRYDTEKLNDIQQQNIRQAGRGYVFIRNEPDDTGKLDWRVVADKSPVRLDLDAAETSLPAMYNTFFKLR